VFSLFRLSADNRRFADGPRPRRARHSGQLTIRNRSLLKEEVDMKVDTELLKPGDAVPASGIYHVTHDKIDGVHHAHPHKVIALRGDTLPACRGCLNRARYRMFEAAERVEAHEHFRVIAETIMSTG
jgi:hypothetical protein